jgi:acetyl-CoA carboxylase carboxyl transferase subunit beta
MLSEKPLWRYTHKEAMSSSAWFQKKPKISTSTSVDASADSRMEGIWHKCDACGEIMLREEFEKNQHVCPACNHHEPWNARVRLAQLCDGGSFEEFDKELEPVDSLSFSDSKKYKERIKSTRRALGENDAFVAGVGKLDGVTVSVGAFLFEYMGGSMGAVVGEKVTRVFERAHQLRCPAIVFSASGGARMQEGIFSLMQMAKTSAAINRFREVGQPYLSVLLHPTTGGVAASFSWLGDVVLAEPKALIGFAGPRVIEQTIRQKLPEGFQRSEFLVERGMIDLIVQRKDMRAKLSQLVGLLG